MRFSIPCGKVKPDISQFSKKPTVTFNSNPKHNIGVIQELQVGSDSGGFHVFGELIITDPKFVDNLNGTLFVEQEGNILRSITLIPKDA